MLKRKPNKALDYISDFLASDQSTLIATNAGKGRTHVQIWVPSPKGSWTHEPDIGCGPRRIVSQIIPLTDKTDKLMLMVTAMYAQALYPERIPRVEAAPTRMLPLGSLEDMAKLGANLITKPIKIV